MASGATAPRSLHGWTGLYGFVALFVFGVSYQLIMGYRRPGGIYSRHRGDIHLAVSVSGMLALLASAATGLPSLRSAGLLLVLLSGAVWVSGAVRLVYRLEKRVRP